MDKLILQAAETTALSWDRWCSPAMGVSLVAPRSHQLSERGSYRNSKDLFFEISAHTDNLEGTKEQKRTQKKKQEFFMPLFTLSNNFWFSNCGKIIEAE